MKARSVIFVDANGNKTITLLRSNTGAAGIMGGVLNCSQSDFLSWWESDVTVNPLPAPPGGVFRPVNQRAVLTFLCADNSQVDVIVPAPSLVIFLADQETLNAANPFVAGLIAACIGNLESSTGSLATAYLGGSRLPEARSPL